MTKLQSSIRLSFPRAAVAICDVSPRGLARFFGRGQVFSFRSVCRVDRENAGTFGDYPILEASRHGHRLGQPESDRLYQDGGARDGVASWTKAQSHVMPDFNR